MVTRPVSSNGLKMVQILVAHLAPVSVHVHRLNFNISFFLQQNLHSLEVHTQIKKHKNSKKKYENYAQFVV